MTVVHRVTAIYRAVIYRFDCKQYLHSILDISAFECYFDREGACFVYF